MTVHVKVCLCRRHRSHTSHSGSRGHGHRRFNGGRRGCTVRISVFLLKSLFAYSYYSNVYNEYVKFYNQKKLQNYYLFAQKKLPECFGKRFFFFFFSPKPGYLPLKEKNNSTDVTLALISSKLSLLFNLEEYSRPKQHTK